MFGRRCNRRGFMAPIRASEDVIRWLESFLGPRREVKQKLIHCELVKVEPMRFPMSVAFYQPRYGTETGSLLGGTKKRKAPKKRKKRWQS